MYGEHSVHRLEGFVTSLAAFSVTVVTMVTVFYIPPKHRHDRHHRHALSRSNDIFRPSWERVFSYLMPYSSYKRPALTLSFSVMVLGFISALKASHSSVGVPVHSALSAVNNCDTFSISGSGSCFQSSVSTLSSSHTRLFVFLVSFRRISC